MSKLSKIRESLKGNPNVIIVAVEEKNYIPKRSDFWSQTVDFIVAPKKGIYTSKELQQFMMSLIPAGLKPSQKDDFIDWGNILDIGELYFDEEIGNEKIRREIVLTDEEAMSTPGFIDGKKIIEYEKKLLRRIWVRVYPDSKIAEENYKGIYRFHIPKQLLRK